MAKKFVDIELQWLQKHKDVIKISAVEREIDCPQYTLQNAMQGKQAFPEKWKEPLADWILKFHKSLDKLTKQMAADGIE